MGTLKAHRETKEREGEHFVVDGVQYHWDGVRGAVWEGYREGETDAGCFQFGMMKTEEKRCLISYHGCFRIFERLPTIGVAINRLESCSQRTYLSVGPGAGCVRMQFLVPFAAICIMMHSEDRCPFPPVPPM